MNLFIKTIILASSLAFLPIGVIAGEYPAPKVEYSGDNTIESNGMSMTMTMYVAKDKQRIEMRNAPMGGSVTIIRKDKNVGWNLMTAQKSYTEFDLEDKKMNRGDMSACSYDARPLGSETVNGYPAEKSHVILKCTEGEYEGDYWNTPEGITVKMDVTGKTKEGEKIAIKSTMSNLKVGKVDPSVFEIPEGYTSMGNTQSMMKDMQRQMDEAKKEQARATEEAKKQEEERKKREAEDEEKRKQEQAAREYSEKKRKQAETPSVKDAVKGGLQKLLKW